MFFPLSFQDDLLSYLLLLKDILNIDEFARQRDNEVKECIFFTRIVGQKLLPLMKMCPHKLKLLDKSSKSHFVSRNVTVLVSCHPVDVDTCTVSVQYFWPHGPSKNTAI